MTGRITMRGLARWAGQGGSDRTVQRCVSQARPWAVRWWCFCRQHGHRADHLDLLAGDAVVVTNAGQPTDGLDRCCARRYGTPVPGWSGCARSRVRVQEQRSCPMRVEQGVRRAAEQAASQANARAKTPHPSTAKRRRGRPQGRQNNAKADVTLTPAW
jgi:putative transposase